MKRLQRIRQSALLRNLTADTFISRDQLIQPLFVVDGLTQDESIPGLRGVNRHSIPSLIEQVGSDIAKGVTQFLLFVIPSKKSEHNFDLSFAEQAISSLKEAYKENMCLWVDVCLCASTTHGHCCVFDDDGKTDIASSTSELARMALAYTLAGADGVAPSDMQDGRVGIMRKTLDEASCDLTPIMSYSTKFASGFYGPFRVAADSAPRFGNRKQYQLDPRNRNEAIAASVRCAEEGADLLMVKPGMTSLDLIQPIHELTGKAVGAYQVSGEYASMVFLAEHQLANFDDVLLESWYALKRGGAQFIITYGARLAKELGI